MTNEIKFKGMNFFYSFTIYISATFLMLSLTKHAIPFLSNFTGWEIIISWFIVGGLGVFAPLLIIAILIIKSEGRTFSKDLWKSRLRFTKLTKKDIIYSISGLAIAGTLSGVIMKGLELYEGKFEVSPSFMTFEPLSAGRFWILLVWLPFWLLNIFGEEILWRGVMQPRQEISLGKYAWLIHGTGWGLFHIAFGWRLLLILIPLLFILPYIVQKTKNSWSGVIMHAGLNAPSFIAISLGLI